jgi:two-component system chemotaxis sensor kinase CheA
MDARHVVIEDDGETVPDRGRPSVPLPQEHGAGSEATAVSTRETAVASTWLPAAPSAPAASMRVGVDEVDRLVNLVGEVVTARTVLAAAAAPLDAASHTRLHAALAELDRNTRELQEAVLSMRMLPVATVFHRFARLVRDLAARLGKEAELVVHGANTELDKGLIERIADPITHLVRNAIDHGIEPPAARRAAGKRAAGTITLSAAHRAGSVIIEVADDGRGLDRAHILAAARARGTAVREDMADAEVWSLVFAPGLSTAAGVTEVSGRGVGMDVVRSNLLALGGSVDIASRKGEGTRVTVRVPLTLAIMDALSVAVGEETYVLPLAAVVESRPLAEGDLRVVAGSRLALRVRDEFLPVLSLHALCVNGVARKERASGVAVVVESDGARLALLVDALLGQDQVVVKSLEANYRRVPGIGGATIMGDGRVALILDVTALARTASLAGQP